MPLSKDTTLIPGRTIVYDEFAGGVAIDYGALLGDILTQLTTIASNTTTIKNDMTTLASNSTTIKNDIAAIKDDIDAMKSSIASIGTLAAGAGIHTVAPQEWSGGSVSYKAVQDDGTEFVYSVQNVTPPA